MSETQTGGRAEGGAPGPARWRKRPVVVDAVQWIGSNFAAVREFASGAVGIGEVADGALPLWAVKWQAVCLVQRGDRIVRETDGSGFRPCAADVFAATHEPAGDATDPDRLASVENALGQGVRMAQSWQEMPWTVTYAEAGRRMLDALGYGEAGPDWPLAFSALAELVRGEYGFTPLAETVRVCADIAGRDEKAVEAVRDAEAYWAARGAGWTQP